MELQKTLLSLFPFDRKELLLAFGVPLAACLIVAVSLAGCNNTEGCGQKAWNEDFWGDPFSGTGFCEETKTDGLLGEKANTLSNFSYIYSGLVIIWIATADLRKARKTDVAKEELFPRNAVTLHPVASYVYGVSMLYLGFGSFLFHAGGNEYLYAHDQASIFVHFAVLITMALSMFVQLDSKNAVYQKIGLAVFGTFFICLFLGLNLARIINTTQALNTYFVCVALLLALIMGNMVWRYYRTDDKPTLFSFGLGVTTAILFIVALIVQEEFVSMPCHPNAFFQFHALWHVLTGVGFFVLYVYFRSNHFSLKKEAAAEDPEGESHQGDQSL